MIEPLPTTASPTISEIQGVVCDIYGVRMDDMMSDRRAREVARPRQVAMFLCKALTRHSLPVIGLHIGRRDHTTVMHGVRTVEQLCRTDTQTMLAVAEASRQLSTVVADRQHAQAESLAA